MKYQYHNITKVPNFAKYYIFSLPLLQVALEII